MADADIMKMKVADLKRELRIRGLTTSGNKNELQERLQGALIDGELSLEDTGINISEDLLDDEGLSDEEKAVLEEEITDQSDLISSALPTKKDNHTTLITNQQNQTQQPKKVILKRKSSIPKIVSNETPIGNNTVKPNDLTPLNYTPSEKIAKLTNSASNKITMEPSTEDNNQSDKKKVIKLSEMSMKERLEMRAKKFGGSVAATSSGKKNSIISHVSTETEDQQIQTLKKRAERFGCVVSSKIANIEKQEKLLKRQQRFGGTADGNKITASGGSTSNGEKAEISNITNVYEEKAKLRLERFKTPISN